MGNGEEVCLEVMSDGMMETENSARADLKRNCEWVDVDGETETRAKKYAKEAPNDTEITTCADTASPAKEGLDSFDLDRNSHASEPCLESNIQDIHKDPQLESSGEYSAEHVVCGNDLKRSPKQAAREACINDTPQSYPSRTNEDGNLAVSTNKPLKDVSDDNELENRVKEASNEDIFSEVSNPNLSPGDVTSSLGEVGSHAKEPVSSNVHGGCAEVSSVCGGNSSSDDSLSERDHSGNEASGEVSTSRVVLEIPEHVSTTGIRKITFKFSKPKVYENVSSLSSARPIHGDYGDGSYNMEAWSTSFADDVKKDVYLDKYGSLFQETRAPLSSTHRELKMSKKVLAENYPANVKKLLSTGILEGARVKYISVNRETELSGIIWGEGYLCSCSSCNFSRVLSAYEFELHAGVKTRHPNNHIYLENGKPVYSIIQGLKSAPLSMIDEVIKEAAGSSINMEKFQLWKASLQQSDLVDNGDPVCQTSMFYPSDISYPGQTRKDVLVPPSFCAVNNRMYQDSGKMVGEQRKRVVKKPGWLLSSSESDVELEKCSEGGTKKRDNDLHRLLFLPNGIPDGTDLAYYSKGKKILGGYKQGNGIVCSCCHTEISPSQFESHAGWAAKRQPYRNIYTSSGLTLHDIALMLANGRNIANSNSDDMCAVCGDAGDLSLCSGCPRAFHAACLGLQSRPPNGWHCLYCSDKSAPVKRGPGRPPSRQTRVVKAPQFVGGGCVVCRAADFSVAKFDDRTVILCDQCEKEYHVGCLRDRGLCDLKELPRDKWFCCNDCNMVYTSLRNFVQNGAQLVASEVCAAIIRKHEEKGIMDVGVSDVKWRLLSGKSRYPEHLPLLSRASAIFRECFDPIVAPSGRDLIPIMVYGRNISGQEFGGMYCIVLIVKSVVVSAALVRIFGKEVAELPLVATSRDNQGKGYFLALFSCIERLLGSMDVKNLVLPAAEEAESIWTKRLGFRKMSNARVSKYNKELQFTVFKGTTMLEKEVQWNGQIA
ncbi:OLC1v1034789C1 [Oldenlandia corymbosa var. corymbosa]|uniref:OLC1v1034789C1 n=1 Tax=Oldenlandia corymbosa var. corymbosa TaxID=529605 RepID=A0AAV1CS32_OLDCO|nr:OLC1v1034789C1 [Oldenlandia corymbosa var. corymbosa]